MSLDALHEKIRKLKNPLIVNFDMNFGDIPPQLLEGETSKLTAYGGYCLALMEALKGVVPGLRFSFSAFALHGPDGLQLLTLLLSAADKLGYFIILDGPEIGSGALAQQTVDSLFNRESSFPADALLVSPYIGSDAIKPFLPMCKELQKPLFLTVRSSNKSASELQDLLTGSRLVHGAAAELVARFGEGMYDKCGFSRICAQVSACAPESIRTLRAKYKYMFFLVDGIDYPSGNAKNCSYAFDRFGYGAAVSAGACVTAAWKEAEDVGYCEAAVLAAERLCKNLLRYVTIL